jgi:hypothetical protein
VRILSVLYCFGDASGKGFGAATQLRNSPEVSISIGVWAWDESEESSNWRDFTNCVETLEEEGAAGRLYRTEVYSFTDSSTVESALYKGSRSSRKLLLLVIRFFTL